MLHILSMKPKTKALGIWTLPSEAEVYRVPLLQHIGKPAIPVVKAGDHVQMYQLLGKAAEGLSANIHSPVSGKVLEVKDIALADGTMVPGVIIENDHQEEAAPLLPQDDGTRESVLNILKEAGIAGEGGAQFPTDVKYRVGNQKINTLIINGTECEPYLTADYALMADRTKDLLDGILIIQSLLQAEKVVITVEKQNKDLKYKFAPLLQQPTYAHIHFHILPNGYPQGGELQLIKSVTGIEVPRNVLPKDAGVIVSNVGTVYSVFRAVKERRPLISRIVTISGEKAESIGNYEIKIGTPLSHIFRTVGLYPEGKSIVLGGPMMGKPVCDPDAPIVKGSSGLLMLKEKSEERGHCISCGYCVEACPMRLMPLKFEELVRKGNYAQLNSYGLSNCIECAACEYTCPANVPLISSIKEGKNKLKQLAHDAKK